MRPVQDKPSPAATLHRALGSEVSIIRYNWSAAA
jgi:hypothetical protein